MCPLKIPLDDKLLLPAALCWVMTRCRECTVGLHREATKMSAGQVEEAVRVRADWCNACMVASFRRIKSSDRNASWRPVRSLTRAQRILKDELIRGKLSASGYKPSLHEIGEIAPHEWSNLEWGFDDGSSPASAMTRVVDDDNEVIAFDEITLASADVFTRFPDRPPLPTVGLKSRSTNKREVEEILRRHHFETKSQLTLAEAVSVVRRAFTQKGVQLGRDHVRGQLRLCEVKLFEDGVLLASPQGRRREK